MARTGFEVRWSLPQVNNIPHRTMTIMFHSFVVLVVALVVHSSPLVSASVLVVVPVVVVVVVDGEYRRRWMWMVMMVMDYGRYVVVVVSVVIGCGVGISESISVTVNCPFVRDYEHCSYLMMYSLSMYRPCPSLWYHHLHSHYCPHSYYSPNDDDDYDYDYCCDVVVNAIGGTCPMTLVDHTVSMNIECCDQSYTRGSSD